MRNTSNWLETTSLETATSIQLSQLQLLQKSSSNVKPNLNQRWWFGWPCLPKVLLISNYVHKSKQAVNQETYLKECINKGLFSHLLSNIIRMEIICFGLIRPKHITQILFKNVWLKKKKYMYIYTNCFSCWQSTKCSSSSSNWYCMDCTWTKDIWKQLENKQILIIWLKESNKLDQEMLQDMIESVWKKLRAMWRVGLYSVL